MGSILSNDAVKGLKSSLLKIPVQRRTHFISRRPERLPLWVKLGDEDASNPGHYKWTWQIVSGAVCSDSAVAAASIYSAVEVNGETGIDAGTIVQLFPAGADGSGNPLYLFQLPQQTTWPCTLTQDGGADGTSTAAPTYTYTCKDDTGTTLTDSSGDGLTGIVPTHNRPIGSTMVGTRGTVWFKSDGTYELYQTDEAPNRIERSCPS